MKDNKQSGVPGSEHPKGFGSAHEKKDGPIKSPLDKGHIYGGDRSTSSSKKN